MICDAWRRSCFRSNNSSRPSTIKRRSRRPISPLNLSQILILFYFCRPQHLLVWVSQHFMLILRRQIYWLYRKAHSTMSLLFQYLFCHHFDQWQKRRMGNTHVDFYSFKPTHHSFLALASILRFVLHFRFFQRASFTRFILNNAYHTQNAHASLEPKESCAWQWTPPSGRREYRFWIFRFRFKWSILYYWWPCDGHFSLTFLPKRMTPACSTCPKRSPGVYEQYYSQQNLTSQSLPAPTKNQKNASILTAVKMM